MAFSIVWARYLIRPLGRLLGGIMVGLVKLYQVTLSPLLGPRCRFWPSCSHYTEEAVRTHGPIKGGWMAIRRLLRCHPGSAGGIDPVPGGPSETLCREDPGLDADYRCRPCDKDA